MNRAATGQMGQASSMSPPVTATKPHHQQFRDIAVQDLFSNHRTRPLRGPLAYFQLGCCGYQSDRRIVKGDAVPGESPFPSNDLRLAGICDLFGAYFSFWPFII
jgi:hypothetical protein